MLAIHQALYPDPTETGLMPVASPLRTALLKNDPVALKVWDYIIITCLEAYCKGKGSYLSCLPSLLYNNIL